MSAINNAKLIFNEQRMTKWKNFLSKKENTIETYLEPSGEISGWLEIKYDKRDQIEKAGLERRDVYGRGFYFRPQGNSVQVFSLGKDRRAYTEDDLVL